jgi:hypothetical protein
MSEHAEKEVKAKTEEKQEPKKESIIKESEFGSRKVFLRRKALLNHLPKEVRADAVSKISSVFVGRQPLRGFKVDSDEEKKYLNELMPVGPSDPKWSETVRKYWAELRIPVGFAGKPLEIGKDEDGNPLNPDEYAQYHFALNHPSVADSEEEMMRNSKMKFYIQDPKKEIKNKNNSVQLGKLADREFIKASDNPKRMRNLLRVLGAYKVQSLDDESVENMLYDIKDKDPKKFLVFAQDENLELRAEISSFIEAGVLQKIGNTILNLDETIAQDEDEAVKVLKNPIKSGLLNTLRARHKELIA